MVVGIFDFYDLSNFETTYKDDQGAVGSSAGLEAGMMIVFKLEEGGEELGKILYFSEESKENGLMKGGIKILRKATAHDMQKFEANKERGKDAVEVCTQLATKYKLDMQPFYGIYSLDGLRVNVIFTADDRVDFRELVKDLAKKLQKQIHLKQIGPRDKARIVDGYGRCGRRFCCKGFLLKLESINMEMVRVQGLEGKGSSKLSGACGKLLCCLKYEVDAYKELKKGLPPVGSKVKFKKPVLGSHDEGLVVSLDVLNKKIKVNVGGRDYVTIDAGEVAKVLSKPIETAPRERGAGDETPPESGTENEADTAA
jgi:cell fate regulator YaaT (PSP1 superfamily)